MFDEPTVKEIKNRIREIVNEFDIEKEKKMEFSAANYTQQRDNAFLDSAWDVI